MGARGHNPNRCRPRTGEIVRFTELGGYYSVRGAADKLGVAYYCLDSWIKRGHIAFARIGNERLVRLEDVTAMKDARAQAKAARQG